MLGSMKIDDYSISCGILRRNLRVGCPYLWHSRLPLEPPAHPIVNAFRFPPVRWDAFEAIALVSEKWLRPYTSLL